MATSEPRISLCIPAWRGQTLARFLESLRKQSHPLDYELRVRDDCSPHGVHAAFDDHHNGESNWHYQRNPKNLGGYHNIRACTQGALGRYVFIISDDDELRPDAFATLNQLTAACDASGAQAALVCDRLNRKYGVASVLPNRFAWLRDVSINVPAFISRVVWRRTFWESYRYDDYPHEMSLPQLDCFVDACLAGPIVAGCRDIVEVGQADNTDVPSYWFYARHAPVDCYEYPTLYHKVLNRGRPDSRTRFWIYARRLSLLRQTYKKILFMRYNEQFYHPSVERFRYYHRDTIYRVFFLPVVWLLLRTPVGNSLAQRRYGEREKLPARPVGVQGY
jgi:glycosyltransferase involved in cell wall biosynthesis